MRLDLLCLDSVNMGVNAPIRSHEHSSETILASLTPGLSSEDRPRTGSSAVQDLSVRLGVMAVELGKAGGTANEMSAERGVLDAGALNLWRIKSRSW